MGVERDSGKKPNFGKPICIGIIVFLGAIVIYLVIGPGNRDIILSQYTTLTNGGKAGITPQLQFLRVYTMTTGDTTLAMSAGLSQDEIENLINTGTTDEPTAGDGSGGSGAINSPWDANTIEEAIAIYKASVTACNMEAKTSNGIVYPVEGQVDYWVLHGGGGNGCHGLGKGCMWFASAVAASMATGNIVGIESLLEARGYSVSMQGGGAYIEPGISYVGFNSGGAYEDGNKCTPAGLLSGFCTVGNDDSSKTYDQSFIESGGVYLVHAANDNNKLYSKTGEHWFVVAGKVNGDYIILNGSGSIGKDGILKSSDLGLINHWMKVSA